MIDKIGLLRNFGAFDNVDSGAQLPLGSFTLIYAENGRGKTTLAAMFRSLANGDPLPIVERKRLGAGQAPHLVVETAGGQTSVFQNGTWSSSYPGISVFDDEFVDQNVCSGVEVETEHRQNLHELIIGAEGVALSHAVQAQVKRIEQHNRDLQTKSAVIPAATRGALSVDSFCALEPREDIDDAIQKAERNLAAAREADAVRTRDHFIEVSLPVFEVDDLNSILSRSLDDLEAEAAARVQAHLVRIGEGSEAWVEDGMRRIEGASADADHAVCPFCAQDLGVSQLITHYQAYFSEAYRELRGVIRETIRNLARSHSGDIQAAFERDVRVAIENQQFWSRFTDVPEIDIDTVPVALAWKEAYVAVESLIREKAASPLDELSLGDGVREKIAAYHALRDTVSALSASLTATHDQIDAVKEGSAAANVSALESDLTTLAVVKTRYQPAVVALCWS